MSSHKRAPNGYRVVLWTDGFYHVYSKDGYAIAEVLTRAEAVQAALIDKATVEAERVKTP